MISSFSATKLPETKQKHQSTQHSPLLLFSFLSSPLCTFLFPFFWGVLLTVTLVTVSIGWQQRRQERTLIGGSGKRPRIRQVDRSTEEGRGSLECFTVFLSLDLLVPHSLHIHIHISKRYFIYFHPCRNISRFLCLNRNVGVFVDWHTSTEVRRSYTSPDTHAYVCRRQPTGSTSLSPKVKKKPYKLRYDFESLSGDRDVAQQHCNGHRRCHLLHFALGASLDLPPSIAALLAWWPPKSDAASPSLSSYRSV